jgi:membrane protease YdiL (CAAX protease family)
LQALENESPTIWAKLSLYGGALLVAPLAEECFFRGLIQPAVRSFTASRVLAIMCSAVAFALVHLGQPHAVPALLVLGLMLATAYELSGTLMVPILVHVLFNLRTLIWHAVGAMPGGG